MITAVLCCRSVSWSEGNLHMEGEDMDRKTRDLDRKTMDWNTDLWT